MEIISSNPYARFEKLWSDFDLHYSYFEEKKVDWDSIQAAYAPKFQKKLSPLAQSLLLQLKI